MMAFGRRRNRSDIGIADQSSPAAYGRDRKLESSNFIADLCRVVSFKLMRNARPFHSYYMDVKCFHTDLIQIRVEKYDVSLNTVLLYNINTFPPYYHINELLLLMNKHNVFQG